MRKLKDYNKIIIFTISILFLLPFVCLFAFSFPQSDDYYIFKDINQLGLEYFKNTYIYWTGRYSGILITFLNPWRWSGIIGFQLSLLSFFLFFIFSVYQFLKSIFFEIKSKINLLSLSFLASFFIIQTSPDLFENIFWYTSEGAYLLGECLLLLFLSRVFKFNNDEISLKIFLISTTIISFFLAGFIEQIGIMLFILVFLFFWFVKIKSKKHQQAILILLVIFSAFMALSIFAPGNLIRYEKIGTPFSFQSALMISTKGILLLIINYLQNPIFIFGSFGAFVIIYLNINSIKITPKSRIVNPLMLLMGTFMILFLTIFSVVIPLRCNPPIRMFNLMSFFGVILWFINLYNLALYINLKQKCNIVFPKWFYSCFMILLFVTAITGTYTTSNLKFIQANKESKDDYICNPSNYSNAVYTLFFRASKIYNNFVEADNKFKQAQKQGLKTVEVKPLYSKKNILISEDPSNYFGKWIKNNEAIFYDLDSIYIIPPVK